MNATKPISASAASRNKLLAGLPAEEYRRLLPDLSAVGLRVGHELLKQGVPVQRVYFLGGGLCSITRATADGQIAAVATVGNEGLIGITAFFGSDLEPSGTAVVEIGECDAEVMNVKAFRREMDQRGALYNVVNRYAHAFVGSLMQSVVCNALHPIEKRCARFLLEIRDRIGRDDFSLTHDVLAAMLGVRRASVTLAAADLHRTGLIDHAQRRIVISNPAGLEAAACECYAVAKTCFTLLSGRGPVCKSDQLLRTGMHRVFHPIRRL